ncbi:unnamed protein product [Meganyctiphanes norvegica]|uniref:Uncharacterized protein n=1 Tax=Meganyctiphanes norvegica TaxID=48144 RepID=A0AAV2SCW8_MEGNR
MSTTPRASLSVALYLRSALLNFLLKKPTGLRDPVSSSCIKAPPVAKSLLSTCTTNCLSILALARTGAVINAVFKCSKAFRHLSDQSNTTPFLVRLVRGKACLA